MTYKTYVFDLDGTLLNTLGDLAAAANYALRVHGKPERTLDEVRRFVGNGVRKLIERAVAPVRKRRNRYWLRFRITIWSIRSTPHALTTASLRCWHRCEAVVAA